MTSAEHAIMELSTTIQPGDVLTLHNGDRDVAAGSPVNTARYRRGEHWLVSIRTSWGYSPVDVAVVHQVERGGVVIWSRDGERTPIQLEMFI